MRDEQSLSHKQIADLCGVGRSTVSNSLRILDLDEPILEALATRQISEGHARTLLSIEDSEERDQLFQEMLEGEVSVRVAEEKAANAPPPPGSNKPSKSAEAKALVVAYREIRALERDKKARQAVTVEEFIKRGAGRHREDGGAYAQAAKVCACSIESVESAYRKYF